MKKFWVSLILATTSAFAFQGKAEACVGCSRLDILESSVTYLMSLSGSATNFIHNQSNLQDGASFYVKQGSATLFNATTIYAGAIVWPNGSVQIASPSASGTGTGMTPGSSYYIWNSSNNQAGATFNVTTGTVYYLNVTTLTGIQAMSGNTFDYNGSTYIYGLTGQAKPFYIASGDGSLLDAGGLHIFNRNYAGAYYNTIAFSAGPNLAINGYRLGSQNFGSLGYTVPAFGLWNSAGAWIGGFDGAGGFEVGTGVGKNTLDIAGGGIFGANFTTSGDHNCGVAANQDCGSVAPTNGIAVEGDVILGSTSPVRGNSRLGIVASNSADKYIIAGGTTAKWNQPFGIAYSTDNVFTINYVDTRWPSSNASGKLTNNGSGILTWDSSGSGGCDFCNYPKDGATNYIQNRDTLQPGATLYVNKATINDVYATSGTFLLTPLSAGGFTRYVKVSSRGIAIGDVDEGDYPGIDASADIDIEGCCESDQTLPMVNLNGHWTYRNIAYLFAGANAADYRAQMSFGNKTDGPLVGIGIHGPSADTKAPTRFYINRWRGNKSTPWTFGAGGSGASRNDDQQLVAVTLDNSFVAIGTMAAPNYMLDVEKGIHSGSSVTVDQMIISKSSGNFAGGVVSTGSSLLNGATFQAGIRMPDGTLFTGTNGISGDLTPFWNYTATDTARANAMSNDTGTFRREYEIFHSSVDPLIANLAASTNSVSADISNLTYYLHTETTGTASAYQLLLSSPMLGAEVSKTKNVTSALGLVKISSHVTRDIDPQIRLIQAGVWTFPTWASVDTLGGITQIVITVSTCSYDLTTITEVLSATSPAFVVTSPERFDLVAVQQSDIFLSTSDRILAQYFARTNLALGGNVSLYLGGTSRPTHVETPISSVYKFVQLADTPKTLVNQHGKYLSVNNDETATVFVTSPTDITNALTTSTGTLNSQITAVIGFANSTGTTLSNSTNTLKGRADAVAVDSTTTQNNLKIATMALANFTATGGAAGGVVNTSTNPVSWTQIKDMPAGFADGTDDGAAGGSGGDSFGSAIATKAFVMNGFAILQPSAVYIYNNMAVGITTPIAQIQASTSPGALYVFQGVFSTGSTRQWVAMPSSWTLTVETVTINGNLIVNGNISVTTNGARTDIELSSVQWTNTSDAIVRIQSNAGLELLTSTAPNAAISTVTASFPPRQYLYFVFAGSASAAIGGDIVMVYNNGLTTRSPIYALGRSTFSGLTGTSLAGINVSSLSAVGIGMFGPDISTNTFRMISVTCFNNKTSLPKTGTYEGTSVSTATEVPSGATGRWGWFSSETISSVSFILSAKNKGVTAGGGTWAVGTSLHVYGRDD